MVTNKKSEEKMEKKTVEQGINRRSFLQSAAAAGATAVLAPNVLAQGLKGRADYLPWLGTAPNER